MNPLDRRAALRTMAGGLTAPLWLPAAGTAADPLPAAPKPTANPYADAKFVPGPPPLPAPGGFTVALLPDTQHYDHFPDGFLTQTKWLVDQKAARNIAAALHLGDITNNNLPAQWELAAKALRQLDGHIPYFLSLGNHDYSEKGVCKDRTTRFNEYFPLSRYKGLPTFGGTYDKEPDRLENAFHRFEAGGRKFLVLNLEFGPRADVVRWANKVAGDHPDHEVILDTHAFVFNDSTRYDWKAKGAKQTWNPHNYAVAKATGDDVRDGEELWNDLVSRHGNFILTVNGHVLGSGLGHLSTKTPGGRDVSQMLVNFQMKPKGGDGWLRLLTFQPGGRGIEVVDYSPTRNESNHGVGNRFAVAPSAVARG